MNAILHEQLTTILIEIADYRKGNRTFKALKQLNLYVIYFLYKKPLAFFRCRSLI